MCGVHSPSFHTLASFTQYIRIQIVNYMRQCECELLLHLLPHTAQMWRGFVYWNVQHMNCAIVNSPVFWNLFSFWGKNSLPSFFFCISFGPIYMAIRVYAIHARCCPFDTAPIAIFLLGNAFHALCAAYAMDFSLNGI